MKITINFQPILSCLVSGTVRLPCSCKCHSIALFKFEKFELQTYINSRLGEKNPIQSVQFLLLFALKTPQNASFPGQTVRTSFFLVLIVFADQSQSEGLKPTRQTKQVKSVSKLLTFEKVPKDGVTDRNAILFAKKVHGLRLWARVKLTDPKHVVCFSKCGQISEQNNWFVKWAK